MTSFINARSKPVRGCVCTASSRRRNLSTVALGLVFLGSLRNATQISFQSSPARARLFVAATNVDTWNPTVMRDDKSIRQERQIESHCTDEIPCIEVKQEVGCLPLHSVSSTHARMTSCARRAGLSGLAFVTAENTLSDVTYTRNAMAAQPPWWIIKGVKPEGPEQHMGSWTAVSFSKEQQERFGIDAEGNVIDKDKFDRATNTKDA